MIDDKKLDEWQRLADAATPRPWHAEKDEICLRVWSGDELVKSVIAEEGHKSDAAFIAAARTAVPELISEVRRVHAIIGAFASREPLYREDADYGWKKCASCDADAQPPRGGAFKHEESCPWRRAHEEKR